MNVNEWQQQHDRMQAYISRLEQQAGTNSPSSEILREAIEALHIAMEEMATTTEEMYEQQAELVQANAQAEAERARYRDLFEFAPDGYLVTDVQGTIREANRAAGQLLNMRQRGMLHGRLLLSFVIADDQSRFLELLKRLQAGEPVRERALRMRHIGGDMIYVEIVAQPITNPDSGEITSMRWMLRDVTERARYEQELQESRVALAEANEMLEQRVAERTAELHASEERFRLVLQDSPVIVFQQDTDLRFIWIHNPIAPFSPADIIGKTEDELIEPENAERLRAIKQRVLDTGEGLREEVPRVTPDETRWYDMKLEPLRDPEGTITGITGVVTDITHYHQQVERERFLAKVSELLITSIDTDSLLEKVAALIVGRFADCCVFALPPDDNRPTLRVVKHRDEERAEPLREWLEQSVQEQSEQHPLLAAMSGSQTVYLWDEGSASASIIGWQPAPEQVRPDGVPAAPIFSLLAVSLVARGQVIGVMGLLNDQRKNEYTSGELDLTAELARRVALALDTTISYETALQARAKAESALNTRDQVFRIVTHDLKTPITSAFGNVYFIKRELKKYDLPDDERITHYTERVENELERLTTQINELLDVARLQADEKLTLKREQVDVVHMMQRLISSLEHSYDRHQFTVEHQSDTLTIAGEKMQLERIFTNLLTNAAKYSDPGTTISVILTAKERSRTPGVYIHVRDEGIGIPSEDLPYVFEPFRRGSNVKEHTSGTGLGLVSARYVVEQHDGIITVTSEEGKGSTFSVWLPLQDGF